MYKLIMVPLDGSRVAEHALPVALSVARRANCGIRLVHVVDENIIRMADFAGVRGAPRATAEEYLENVVRRIAECSDVPVSTVIREGSVTDSLLAERLECGAELSVMTTHGTGGVSRAWLGSVTDFFVRHAIMPVLTVRPRDGDADLERDVDFRHIVIPLDGSPAAEQILDPAARFAATFGARVTLLRVIALSTVMAYRYAAYAMELNQTAFGRRRAEAQEYLETVARRFREQGLEVTTAIGAHESPATGILLHVAEVGADGIAMSTRGRSGIRRAVLGSVTDKVIRAGDLPVLIYRARE
ncbi:MAG TPA: universal stress protein [Longimicrobiales bacterium]|nr:universal stress protein [Longimicrobiales bacterium]